MKPDWPFSDPPNVATITLRSIVELGQPIVFVSHDVDDGCWQFLDGSAVREDDAMVLGLREIVQLDNSVLELADLPLGWYAHRASRSEPWIRAEKDW